MREGTSRWGLFVLLLSHAALATAIVLLWARSDPAPESDLYWNDTERLEVQSLIEQRYVDPVDPVRAEELFHAALNGYVHRLDPFSRYFSPAERRELDEDTRGSFSGIGVHITSVPEGLHVTSVRIDGPADVAGIRPGEILVSADGETFAGKDQSDLIAMIKGEPETVVEIGVVDAEGRERAVTVTRGIVSAGTEEPNALVQLEGPEDEPNVRATTHLLSEGLCASSLNRWPGLHFDLAALNDRISAVLPAGFYYKTFFGGLRGRRGNGSGGGRWRWARDMHGRWCRNRQG